eukprot:7830318-Lingulodinium_polyedra.AAC.1
MTGWCLENEKTKRAYKELVRGGMGSRNCDGSWDPAYFGNLEACMIGAAIAVPATTAATRRWMAGR